MIGSCKFIQLGLGVGGDVITHSPPLLRAPLLLPPSRAETPSAADAMSPLMGALCSGSMQRMVEDGFFNPSLPIPRGLGSCHLPAH